MTNQGKTGIDRRSALKKAAAGGAIAWAAPTILSSRVSAAPPACTIKCCPQTAGSFLVTAFEACPTGSAGRKAFYVQATNPGSVVSCPCGGSPANIIVSTDVNGWTRHGSPLQPDGTCRIGQALDGINVTTGDVNGVASIIFDKPSGGAIPQGCFRGPFIVKAECTDRDGDVCQITCLYTANITYIPNAGSCVDAGTIGGGVAFLEGCTTACL